MALPTHELLSAAFRVVAYRGGSGERPENTLQAFENAACASPAVVLELDVRRTLDGVLVAAHDDCVSRMTGASGKISELSYVALRELDAGFGFEQNGQFPYRERALRIPRVDEVLGSFPRHALVLDVHAAHSSIARDVSTLVERHGAAGRVVVASEMGHIVQQIRRQHPSWLYAGTHRQLLTRVILERARLDAWAPRTGGVLMIPETSGAFRVLTERFVARAQRRGERIWVWVVENATELERLRAFGIDGVFTPHPSAFLRHLADCPASFRPGPRAAANGALAR